jgi:N4-gp56 family major capsid protein
VAATGTVELSAEVKAAYSRDYYIAGQNSVYFDQLAYLKEVESGQKGISYNWPMIESLQPQPTAISEYADVTPQRMTGNELSVTLQEFGSAVEVTRFVSATSYADVYEQAALVNGYSMAESVDLVARAVLGQGVVSSARTTAPPVPSTTGSVPRPTASPHSGSSYSPSTVERSRCHCTTTVHS